MTARCINDRVSVIPFPELKSGAPTAAPNPFVPDYGVGSRNLLRLWVARTAFRRNLQRLLKASPHLVRDIGLDETLVRREVTLPFWSAGQLTPEGVRLPLA